MTVSGRFTLLVALGVVPIVLLGRSQAAAGGILALWLLLSVGLGLLDLALAGSPRAVRLERRLPARVRLGETVTSLLYVTNSGSRRLRALVRDAWQPSAGAGNNRTPLSVPTGERRLVSLPLTPFRRGERRVDRVTIRSYGPLGLWARQATLEAPGRIRVLPPFNARKHLPSRITRLKELDGRTSVLVRGQGTEFDSLREYVRGDDVRSIDWRATARHNDVVVRTWRPERDRRVVIVIDTGRTSAARIDNETRLDTAFEAALLLAALASKAGDRVDMVAFDRRVRGRVQGAQGAELLSRMVDTLAVIDPELLEMDWAGVPAQVRAITSQRALVVLLTSIDAAGASTGLLAVLPQLTRRHTVVVASVTDPTTVQATHERADREQVYRAAAAERALLDVARVAAAIRQQGADVVTGPPADLPPRLADHYLALKLAGRL
ncbi:MULTISPECIES: DUF58 domain-containing protein [unclassified Cryobacterium]|uniref:DUF58 domain-containing protein n=1 Tax=unclassified Cryobacterium TaxID=2649013 RepID=UPI00106A7780|nr:MULTISPECIES: DUF58 domain-containing protein [unclassified Cryobacterium]MDY7526713.1 DUF58 domain-containing protein [Cryobacterium sp. 10C2]MDY7557482.1 DUF58 domain-containing protein [Cryobacterium sp. 10C3]MEB0004730.1 DUF58 domain-containing protein [Cryobacterium sp. RTC2.1]MEB0203156.1 DUF58 domain-containing protein [Cryobacterium sp. 5I3]MEB0287178.1 DUF58 domain-containing protein [Cryobacterium sp. 10S3]